jgi:hypothetical protein
MSTISSLVLGFGGYSSSSSISGHVLYREEEEE